MAEALGHVRLGEIVTAGRAAADFALGQRHELQSRDHFEQLTRLFANLEELVPNTVHLVSLTPDVGTNGAIALNIIVRGRSIADVSQFIEALERSSPVFEKVAVSIEQKSDLGGTTDVELSLTANYYPQKETR